MWVLGGHWCLSEGQSCALSGAVCLQIREEIDQYGIRIYQFPECDSDEDEEFKLQDQALKLGLAPLVPSLEEQSPMAKRTSPPRVALGFFGAPQGLQQPQHGEVGTYCIAQMCHQDPAGATCSLWGWGGETHAAVPPGSLHGWGSGRSWQMGMDTAQEMHVEGHGPRQPGSSSASPCCPPAGKHPLRRHWQQHNRGGQRPARPWAPLPLGHRGR